MYTQFSPSSSLSFDVRFKGEKGHVPSEGMAMIINETPVSNPPLYEVTEVG